MQVCFVGPYPPSCGASAQAYWAARGLADRGHHVDFVTEPAAPGDDPAARAVLLARRASQVIAESGCRAIVAAAAEPYAAAGYLAARWSGRPLLIRPAEPGCALPESVFTPAAGAEQPGRGPGWLQYGLTPQPGRLADLYAAVRASAAEALGAGLAAEFFYLHKPPGMRLRFLAAGSARPELAGYLSERLSGWERSGLITGLRAGVYEPEEHLFGGPVSMRSVHRVFTADSLAWLGYHAAADPGPSWAMSLLLVRGLLDALRVVGWEDLDVWDRLRRQAGRRLGPGTAASAELARLSAALKPAWSSPAALAALLSPGARQLAETYREAVLGEGERWFADYFESGTATAGPRAVAAFAIVFHWNRGRFSGKRQALLTEALLAAEPGAAR